MIEHKAPISGVAAFKDQYVATAGYDNQVILWDARGKKALGRGVHDHLANQCRFSSCGRYLVSSGSDQTARIWEVPSMKLLAVLSAHDDDVEAVAFHPTQPLVATASRDAAVRVFDLSGKLRIKMEGHAADVISVEWLDSGEELVTSSDDGTVKRWDVKWGAMIEDYDLGDVETDTIVVTERAVLFAGNDDGEIVAIVDDKITRTSAHSAGIKRLIYNAANRSLVSLSYDRTMKVFAVADDGALTLRVEATMPSVIWPRSCAFIGNDALAFATFGSSYGVLDLRTLQWDLAEVGPTGGVNAVLETEQGLYTVGDAGVVRLNGREVVTLPSLCNFLTPVGDRIITGGQTGQIFDAVSGEVVYQHRSPLNCGAAYLRGGRWTAVVGTYTGEGLVIERRDGRLVFAGEVPMHKNAIKSLSTDGKTIVGVAADAAIAFHDAQTLEPSFYKERAHDKIANGCVVVSDGVFASISRDLKLRIWRGKEVLKVDTPHAYSIKCVAASADGELVATGSYGGYVAVYHVPSGTWVDVSRPTAAGISCLTTSADGSFLASSYDGRVYRIEAAAYRAAV